MAIFSEQTLNRMEESTVPETVRHTVMIVDDKDANLSVMAAILRPYYHLLEARDGQEALNLIEEFEGRTSLACIVSDHRMPRLTGVELFEQVQLRLPLTTRVIVSGFIDVDTIIDSINKAEIYRFIAKPFDANDFLLAVKGAVEAYDTRRQLVESHERLLEANQALRVLSAQVEALSGQLESARAQLLEFEKK